MKFSVLRHITRTNLFLSINSNYNSSKVREIYLRVLAFALNLLVQVDNKVVSR
jgi:hypothetical protein